MRTWLGAGTDPRALRQPEPAEDDRGQGDRHVDEERRTPSPFLAEHGDEPATEDGPDAHGDADDRAEHPEGATADLAVEVLLEHPHALGAEQTGAQPHDDAGDVEHERVRGQSRDEGPEGEDGHADDEEPTTAEEVAGSTGGDEEYAEGERIAREHPLDRGVRGADRALHAGENDVDDRHTQQRHEHRDEHHRKDLALFGSHDRLGSITRSYSSTPPH